MLFELAPELLAQCVTVDFDDIAALLRAETHGDRRQWHVQWLYFREQPFVVPRAREDGAAMLSRVRANALLAGDVEAKLERAAVACIPFPPIADTTRRSFSPRVDVALDLAVRGNDVLALRIVRARRGIAHVHPLGVKR